MCGIAGIVTTKDEVSLRALEAMERAMVHRGPDSGGIYFSRDRKAGLVNRRLAIIDLSPAGHQPMSTSDKRFTIVHNGEVYNYKEIRETLERKGYKFKSNTDTEVILYSYAEWGPGCLEKFRGMYAFAIWDEFEKKLFLARDRLGIKPVYYSNTRGTFVFASELKALKSSGLISSDINPAALVSYFMLGSVPYPMTIYQSVYALNPGSYLIRQNGVFKIYRYWDLPVQTGEVNDKEEAVERIKELLLESVRLRMISDVPLGAFLSGGLDSSSIVALMRKVSNGTIRTCSMVFEEKEYSEASYAKAVAEAFETEHYERVITLEDLKAEWDKIFWAMDQPTIDGVNTYFVSKTAKEAGLKVALSGLGGDELFGGYPNTFRGIPKLLKLLKFVQGIPAGQKVAVWALNNFATNSKFNKLSDALSRPPTLASAYLVMRGLFSFKEVKSLVLPEIWNEAIKGFNPLLYISEQAGASFSITPNPLQLTPADLFNWISRAELRTYTHNQLLRDTDVMSMAHSLEVRVPLLDHVLMEEVLKIPGIVKADRNKPKILLISALDGLLPKLVAERKDKMGFTFPFALWLGRMVKEASLLPNEVPFLRKEALKNIIEGFRSGKIGWSRLWSVLVWNEWSKSEVGIA